MLFAGPMRIHGRDVPDHAPAGWPYGLRWIQVFSSGIDSYPDWLFDLPVATGRGSNAVAIAEFALAAIFAAAKQLPAVWRMGTPDAPRLPRPQLASVQGSRIGVVGYGAIGRALAEKAIALGAHVQVVRRSALPLDLPQAVRADDLRQLFAESDHIVLAVPLTPTTRGMVDARLLEAAKPGLHLVNVARGGLLDHAALLAALDDGRIGVATLDVTEPEPLPPEHPLRSHPGVRLSSHIAGASPDLFDNVLAIFLHNLRAWQAGEPLSNRVRAEDHAAATWSHTPSPQEESA
ncbi:NAD(P)-dependent oxidoreductase [Xanthomonas hyacinthi]|uniref:NAD(P)-dependent oxidoreductase n=1 Tax=Xanthomonas hyacinthi TaxID=56455 RepID=UPI001AD62BB0|nr:NAD(P)-dependent oxidoreductase [Xanthomonas hyacinthi]